MGRPKGINDSRGNRDGRKQKSLGEQIVERFPEIYPPPPEDRPVQQAGKPKRPRRQRPLIRSSHTRLSALYAERRSASPIEVALRLRREAAEICHKAIGAFTSRGRLIAATSR